MLCHGGVRGQPDPPRTLIPQQDGKTPLYIATSDEEGAAVAEMLLSAGANPLARSVKARAEMATSQPVFF